MPRDHETDKLEKLIRTLSYVRARNKGISDPSALEMALMVELGSQHAISSSRGVLGGYNPSLAPHVAALVSTVMRRCEGELPRAAQMACHYVLLAHHISDVLVAQSNPHAALASPRWTTVLRILLGDEDRLDVVDHLSQGGEIPLDLIVAMYV